MLIKPKGVVPMRREGVILAGVLVGGVIGHIIDC